MPGEGLPTFAPGEFDRLPESVRDHYRALEASPHPTDIYKPGECPWCSEIERAASPVQGQGGGS